MAFKSSELVFDLHMTLVEATEVSRLGIDTPDTVVDLLEAHVLAYTHDVEMAIEDGRVARRRDRGKKTPPSYVASCCPRDWHALCAGHHPVPLHGPV